MELFLLTNQMKKNCNPLKISVTQIAFLIFIFASPQTIFISNHYFSTYLLQELPSFPCQSHFSSVFPLLNKLILMLGSETCGFSVSTS